MSFDPRAIGDMNEDPKDPDVCPDIHGFAASSNGYALRFTLAGFAEPSTRSGRRFARCSAGASIVGVEAIDGDETILAISAACRAVVCPADEVNYLSGPGKGVMLIKLAKTDRLLGFKASRGERTRRQRQRDPEEWQDCKDRPSAGCIPRSVARA